MHTRDARLYFNDPRHVDGLLEAFAGRGLLDDPRPKLLVVDGFTPSLQGEAWNADLEDWKNGIGRVRETLDPVGLWVRTQVGASTARYSRGRSKSGENVAAEDAIGGQIVQWPDNRLTINRVKDSQDLRRLNIRGRLVDTEFEVTYEWDQKTYWLQAVDANQQIYAILGLNRFMDEKRWTELQRPDSVRAVAGLLATEDTDVVHRDPVSLNTFRRVLDAGYEWDEDSRAWRKRVI